MLKDTGSLYLHCDPTANHYLKLMLDAIFGRDNFRNEIIWKRTSAHSDAKAMGAVHDCILYYAATDKFRFNPQHVAYDKEYVETRYKRQDKDGRKWMDDNLTAKGLSGGGYEYEYKGKLSIWRVPLERMKELDEQNRLYFTRNGGIRIKRYLDEMKGLPLSDVWTDINPINSQSKERVGYPTQKPLALLDRIIRASSNPGDVALDPFCGCATALVAANRLNRQWVGIDLSAKAGELVVDRIKDSEGLFGDIQVREDIPKRTDLGPPLTTQERREYKGVLYGLQVGRCNGCNTHFERLEDFHMDHIVARARGGTDHDFNFQLLCGHCNSTKGTKTQAEFAAIISEKRKDFSWI